MSSDNLIDAVDSLTPEEQTSVLRFFDYLKRQKGSDSSPFLRSAEQFIAEHPELLQRLSR